jgi:hypothetical protein
MLIILEFEKLIDTSCTLTEHHAMKACWRSGCIAPRIFDLGIKWRWVVNFTPRLLYPQGKSLLLPLDRSQSGRGGEDKYSQPLPGLETPIIQSVARRYTAELSRLHTPKLRYENVYGGRVGRF